MDDSASLRQYAAYLDGKSRPRPAAHWQMMNRLRGHRPSRPDRLAEIWNEFRFAHGDDQEAALGAIVVAVADVLLEDQRRRPA